MTSLPGFTVQIDQNPYLPVGGRDVSAVVTVTADATGDTPPEYDSADGSAEIIIVDCSGSMDFPPEKIRAARAATSAAVDVIRDGARFAIVAGTNGNLGRSMAGKDRSLLRPNSIRRSTAVERKSG